MRVAWGAIFLSLMISVDSSSAQTVGASLQGTVYDPSGGYVPGASIEIRNVENGGVRTLTTDDHGRYREPLLSPGEYELHVRVSGFQPAVLKGIQLTIGQDAVLDVKLEITKGIEQVHVTAEDVPSVELASAALSGTVNRTQMNDLPLNGRSFQELALLQPGVNAAVAAGSDAVLWRNGAIRQREKKIEIPSRHSHQRMRCKCDRSNRAVASVLVRRIGNAGHAEALFDSLKSSKKERLVVAHRPAQRSTELIALERGNFRTR